MSSSAPPPDSAPAPPGRPAYTWFDKFSAVVFCVFCLEVGIFLLFCPWVDALWSRNWLLQVAPAWRPFFLSRHFRGALSGLGLLNLIIGVLEIGRLRRFSGG